MVSQRTSSKRADLLQLLLSIVLLVLMALVSDRFFVKLDLTEEKRHTLTSSTVDLLEQMDDQVFVRCYLSGDYPAMFKRLERSIRERLDEFNDYSDGKVSYEFINPYASGDERTIGETEQALYEEGLRFTRIAYEENGVRKFQNVWPAAIMSYKGRTIPVQLFRSENPEPSDEMVNQSVNNIEYELTSRLRMLMRSQRPAVAILDECNGLLPVETADIELSLKEYYDVERVALNQRVDALSEKPEGSGGRINKYDLLIVAKPDSVFTNKDKVVIDQFIMNGGRVLWLVDPIRTSLDSLRKNQFVLAESNELGVYDMLFDYGVRMNRNLILDFRCALIALDGGPMGNQRSMQMSNWYFAPVALPSDDPHPISSNLDPVHFDFVSSLDTVGENPLVKKTVLLASSELSLERKAPVRVSANIAELDLEYFKNGPHQSYPLAVLLEGEFYSNFRGRLPDTLMRNPEFAFREKSLPTRMIVIGDGDIIRNKVMPVQGGLAPFPLGFDRYANRVIYDNKEFLMNAVNYLLDDPELISVRSRTIELRKLDAALIREQRNLIQFINVAVPIAIVVALGIAVVYIRKRKYSKQ